MIFKTTAEEKSVLTLARSLIEASDNCTDDTQIDTLLTWARTALKPLVDEGIAEALWLSMRCESEEAREGKTDTEFEAWYLAAAQKAADAGDPDAQFCASTMLFDKGNHEASNALCRKAADAGHAYAKWCFGLDLISGTGTDPDEELGLQYIKDAAGLKFEGAIRFMSDAFALGQHGFPIDTAQSARWQRILADKDVIHF